MREIKFRAWHRVSKKMFDVLSIDLDPEFGGVWKWGKAYHDHDTGEHEADKDFIVHDQIELMQFTGMKDRNSKDIYEGDILLVGNHTPEATELFYPHVAVYWHVYKWVFGETEEGWWDFQDWYFERGKIEVIGNIYEDPELL